MHSCRYPVHPLHTERRQLTRMHQTVRHPRHVLSELEKDINKTSSSGDPEGDTVKEVVAEEPPKKRRKRQFSTDQTLIVTYFKLTAASKVPGLVD